MRAKRVRQSPRFLWFILPISLVVLGTAAAMTPVAAGQNGSVIYEFHGGLNDGSRPYGALVADQADNLYGATGIGGDSEQCYLGAAKKGCGAIFELTPPSVPDGSWTEVLLHSFQGETDGDGPGSPLLFDQAGNLFGTTQGGGSNLECPNCGTVFELSPPTSEGGAWKETVIHRFGGGLLKPDGATPNSGLVFDKNGNLYGTTFNGGGPQDVGIVFELSPPPVSGGAWKETVIHRFNFEDGANPLSSLIIHNGALYGMTIGGGLDCYNDGYGCGIVYKLVPPATAGDPWSEEVLYRFGQFGRHPDDGTNPAGGLIFDTLGNLYGTTNNGGGTQCVSYVQCGTVFQLSPPIGGLGPWTETTLWEFAGGSDGSFPQASLVMDSQGALYGTTPAGGSGCLGGSGCGIVFKLVPPAMPGVSWSEQVLHVFGIQRGDGEVPLTALLPVDGKFYGTTEQGGAISPTCYGTCGTIFTITP
jgi:uncharacterized repeat protein (TIGR03803 family)